MMFPNGLLTFFFFFGCFAYAQEVTVIDALTKEPIFGVSLYNQDNSSNTTTGVDGKFSLSMFSSKDIISFQFMGFELQSLSKNELKQKNKYRFTQY